MPQFPSFEDWSAQQAHSAAQRQQEMATAGRLQDVGARAAEAGLDIGQYLAQLDPRDQASALRAEGAVTDWMAEREALQGQAQKWEDALRAIGGATEDQIRNLTGLAEEMRASRDGSAAAWDQVIAQGDEYVEAARNRTAEVMGQIDHHIDQINALSRHIVDRTAAGDEAFERQMEGLQDHLVKMEDDLAFAKAHDIQAAVQGALGQMRQGENDILRRYGRDSAEYRQFQQAKQASLANATSNIHVGYAQLRDAQNQSIARSHEFMVQAQEASRQRGDQAIAQAAQIGLGAAGLAADVAPQMAMYEQYHEKAHLEMMAAAARESATAELQFTESLMTIERLKTAGMENFASWLTASPDFAMLASPLFNDLAAIIEDQQRRGGAIYGGYGPAPAA